MPEAQKNRLSTAVELGLNVASLSLPELRALPSVVKYVVGSARHAYFNSPQPNSSIRQRVTSNIRDNQTATGSSNFKVHGAKEDQLRSGYKVDEWTMTILRKGDTVYGGLPGRSGYYTDQETILAAHGDKVTLGRSLQIEPHPYKGYRDNIGQYELLKEVKIPFGEAQANHVLGSGGMPQYFIKNHSSLLRLKNEYNLEEFYGNQLSRNKFGP